ncbi:MFS transporter [Streptomonospora nanhaiensis]|uniref:MFS transporter n=1 Tax=Streptomonospora nanhaiensis TaxID=1323731 RepID=UPI001C38BEA4|nr:MFS transporter [Streptomonospora nanhaiensis]MBV2361977.1 MFS transporter [Streptomonospora nanhaiensis]
MSAPGARRALVALCVTVTTSYGVLLYAFPVLAPAISADTGWSLGTVTAAYSAAQVTSALAQAAVGRWLERAGPRAVMTTAAALAVPAVAGIALAPGLPVFFLAWLAAGAATAGLFYPPAFAAITGWFGEGRVRALTALTLVAGLSSTVFAPLTAALEAALGWRGAYGVLALVLLCVVLPLHAAALTPPWRPAGGAGGAAGAGRAVGLREVVADRAFLALTAALTLGAFGVYAVVVNIVPLLGERGFDTAVAAWALGVGGVGQVLGRLAYAPLERRAGPVARAVAVLAACAASTALLTVVTGPLALVMAVSLLAGMARGIFTLLQATAVADRWGTARYAALNGILHSPLMLAIALAPWAGAALAGLLGGYPAMFAVLAAIGAAGALLAPLTRPAGAGGRGDPRPA